MPDKLCDNPDVMASLLRALCDPGQILPRDPAESVPSWQRRAVIEFAVPYIQAAAVKAERERITAAMRQGFEALDSESQAVLAAMMARWAAAMTEDPGVLGSIAQLLDGGTDA